MKYLFLPDTHFPYSDNDAMTAVFNVVSEMGPFDKIIQLGDLYDQFAYSKFSKHIKLTPIDEMRQAQEMASHMWEKLIDMNEAHHKKLKLKRAVKKQDAYHQIKGNHDVRIFKRLEEKCPDALPFIELDSIYRFKDVNLHTDVRDPLVVDSTNNLIATHGHKTKQGQHVRDFLGSNVVFGHIHRAWIHYEQNINPKAVSRYEMCCGYLGDQTSAALSYTQTTWSKWQKAVGIVDEFGPRLIVF